MCHRVCVCVCVRLSVCACVYMSILPLQSHKQPVQTMSDSFTSSSDINKHTSSGWSLWSLITAHCWCTTPFLHTRYVYICVLVLTLSLTWIGHSAFGDKLSEQDAKGPDVWLDGETAVQRSFWGRPFNREFGSCVWWRRQERGLGEVLPLEGIWANFCLHFQEVTGRSVNHSYIIWSTLYFPTQSYRFFK